MSKFRFLIRGKVGNTKFEPGDIVNETTLEDRNWRAMLRTGVIEWAESSGVEPEPAPGGSPVVVSDSGPDEAHDEAEQVPLSEMTASEIVDGLEDGSLDSDQVELAELSRANPRITVLRALGIEDDG